MGVLGVVLAFSPDVIYDHYEHAPRTWGLSPLEDLNVGGVVMMVEQSIVLVIFFAIAVRADAGATPSRRAAAARAVRGER